MRRYFILAYETADGLNGRQLEAQDAALSRAVHNGFREGSRIWPISERQVWHDPIAHAIAEWTEKQGAIVHDPAQPHETMRTAPTWGEPLRNGPGEIRTYGLGAPDPDPITKAQYEAMLPRLQIAHGEDDVVIVSAELVEGEDIERDEARRLHPTGETSQRLAGDTRLCPNCRRPMRKMHTLEGPNYWECLTCNQNGEPISRWEEPEPQNLPTENTFIALCNTCQTECFQKSEGLVQCPKCGSVWEHEQPVRLKCNQRAHAERWGFCPVHGGCTCPSEVAAPKDRNCKLHGNDENRTRR